MLHAAARVAMLVTNAIPASGLRQTVTGIRAGTTSIVVEGDAVVGADTEVEVTVR